VVLEADKGYPEGQWGLRKVSSDEACWRKIMSLIITKLKRMRARHEKKDM
jgi:hypothetical protein